MSKFKVGDKVRVINNPNTNMHYYMDDRSDWQAFVFDMPSMAGKAVTISSVSRYGYRIKEHKWFWTDEMFDGLATEPREFIVVRRDGPDVIASHKRGDEIVKTAKAKCAPSDEFSFRIGARLAFDRLVGREEPKPKIDAPAPKFKVGDRVMHKAYGEGIVESLNSSGNTCIVVFDKIAHPAWCVSRELSPAPEPKYYTGKVFALETLSEGTKEMKKRTGHVFEIKNGVIQGDCSKFGMASGGEGNPYVSFADFCQRQCATTWMEVCE